MPEDKLPMPVEKLLYTLPRRMVGVVVEMLTAMSVFPKFTPTGIVTVPPPETLVLNVVRFHCANAAVGTRRLETRRKTFVFGKRAGAAGRRGERGSECWNFVERICFVLSSRHFSGRPDPAPVGALLAARRPGSRRGATLEEDGGRDGEIPRGNVSRKKRMEGGNLRKHRAVTLSRRRVRAVFEGIHPLFPPVFLDDLRIIPKRILSLYVYDDFYQSRISFFLFPSGFRDWKAAPPCQRLLRPSGGEYPTGF
jgi:hypothetical protein